MNAIGYDARALGNHDVDFGVETAARFTGAADGETSGDPVAEIPPFPSANVDVSPDSGFAALDEESAFDEDCSESHDRDPAQLLDTTGDRCLGLPHRRLRLDGAGADRNPARPRTCAGDHLHRHCLALGAATLPRRTG